MKMTLRQRLSTVLAVLLVGIFCAVCPVLLHGWWVGIPEPEPEPEPNQIIDLSEETLRVIAELIEELP